MQSIQRKEANHRLRETVLQQFEFEPEITSTDIGVGATDGVVTLTGFVHSYAEKFAAERAAKKVFGVVGLANDIEVKSGAQHTDPEIARDVVQSLLTNTSIPDGRITAAVRDGGVTLEGAVDWAFQRESAEAVTRALAGVRGIDNQIRVKPPVSRSSICRP